MPIWSTRLAKVLIAWMAIALISALGFARLMELLPGRAFSAVLVALYVAAPLVLLVWSIAAVLGRPHANWPALVALLLFCGVFVAANEALFDASIDLNFLSHRSAYDRIVADARRGRLGGVPDPSGHVTGERDGVRYSFLSARTLNLQFDWSRDSAMILTVVYDEQACPERPAPSKASPPGLPPAVRDASFPRHLSGHYCLMQGIS
jgi:hypothetical protein